MYMFLVIYKNTDGLQNFGFFNANDQHIAILIAKKSFNTTGKLIAINVDNIFDGWQFSV